MAFATCKTSHTGTTVGTSMTLWYQHHLKRWNYNDENHEENQRVR